MKKIVLILAISAMFISCQSPIIQTTIEKNYTVEIIDGNAEVETK